MSHTITPGSHPNYYFLTYSNELEYDELFIDDELHLNEGRPIYLLIDTSQMTNALPEHFFEGIVRSFVVNPNVGHLAVYIPSSVLRVAGYMVVSVTQRQKQITIHQTYDDAARTISTMLQRYSVSPASQNSSSRPHSTSARS